MSQSRITLIGMYNYNPDIFDLLTVPEDINKPTLIDNILIRSGGFEVLYPDHDFLKFSIGAWSRKWQPTFERWASALAIEYNPLENYDRKEDWTDTASGSESGTNSGSDSVEGTNGSTTTNKDTETTGGTTSGTTGETVSGTTGETVNGTTSGTTSGTTGSDTKLNKSAYDQAAAYTPVDQTVVSGTDSTTSSGTTSSTSSGTSSSTTNGTSSETTSGSLSGTHTSEVHATNSEGRTSSGEFSTSRDNETVHEGRIHGNIGVTTSQQMLVSELDLGYWNIYEKITDIFLTEFVIPIY